MLRDSREIALPAALPSFCLFIFLHGVKYYQLVTVTCRWMLPVFRSVFQAAQGDSQRKKGLSPGCWTLGRTWIWEKGQQFYLWDLFVMQCWLCLAAPWQCQQGGCRQAWASTAWMLLWALCWASAVSCAPAAWQLPEKFGWAAWLCLLHLSNLLWFDSAPASLSSSGRDGTDTLPSVLWSGSSKQNPWAWLCPTGSCLAAIQLESHVLSAGTKYLQHDFFTDINQWGSKCVSHLHTFRLGGCVFGMGLTNILAALLIKHPSALTEGFHFSFHIW